MTWLFVKYLSFLKHFDRIDKELDTHLVVLYVVEALEDEYNGYFYYLPVDLEDEEVAVMHIYYFLVDEVRVGLSGFWYFRQVLIHLVAAALLNFAKVLVEMPPLEIIVFTVN